jgi:hypothetical protein
MLDINEPHAVDESIQSMHFYEYVPQSNASNNTIGHNIKIDINAQDIYTLPSRSYLEIKGQLRRANNNNAYAANDEISLINNAIMYLFTEIRYDLGSVTLEKISSPGQTTTMLTLLSQPDDFSTSAGLKYMWGKDTTQNANSSEFEESVAAPAVGYRPTKNALYNQGFATRRGLLLSSDPRGSFSVILPLSHIFGFAEYKKIIYGERHTLTLTRGSDTLAIHRVAGVTDGKIDLTSISWYMPQVVMNTEYLTALRSLIEQKAIIPIAFRARTSEQIAVTETQKFTWRLSVTGGVEKPRYIIVAFQTNRGDTQEQNPAVFDHLNLKNAFVTLNSDRFPPSDIITNYGANDYAKLYDMFDSFKKDYYGIDSLVGGTQVNFPAFKSLYPILVFDVRRQSERLKSGVIDIQVKFEFNANVPANTTAYTVIISDRFFKMSSDGKNMRVVSV